MKICFIGNVIFSEKLLSHLIKINCQICGVISNTKNRYNNDYANLKPICEVNNIKFLDVVDINSQDVLDWVKDINADIIFCFGWSQIIKKELLKIPQMGIIGYHPALLPKNRGRHPIIWALFLGLKETGSTFFFINEGVDSGDIISQRKVKITYNDNATSLYFKILKVAIKQISEIVSTLQNGVYEKQKQNYQITNTWRKRGINDGKIDFRMSSRAIYYLVRAISKPYVGAHIVYLSKEIKVWKVKEEKINIENAEPGKIIALQGDEMIVKTYDGAIKLIEHEFSTLPKVGEYL